MYDGHCLFRTAQTMSVIHFCAVRNMYAQTLFVQYEICMTDIVCAVRNMYDGHCLSVHISTLQYKQCRTLFVSTKYV